MVAKGFYGTTEHLHPGPAYYGLFATPFALANKAKLLDKPSNRADAHSSSQTGGSSTFLSCYYERYLLLSLRLRFANLEIVGFRMGGAY